MRARQTAASLLIAAQFEHYTSPLDNHAGWGKHLDSIVPQGRFDSLELMLNWQHYRIGQLGMQIVWLGVFPLDNSGHTRTDRYLTTSHQCRSGQQGKYHTH